MTKFLIVLTILGGYVGSAYADGPGPLLGKDQDLYLTLSTLGTTTLTGFAVYGTVAITQNHMRAALYLRKNNANIQEALASGDGIFIDDMVAVFLVPSKDRARFAAALTEHYVELTDLAALEQLTEARAMEFFDKIHLIRQSLRS